ncbi:hypothetical protein ZTR_02230 [Talaromyces verruculosus]|nr:hypothetical protein ZTR_02230 [Talaromyces verruculosus]
MLPYMAQGANSSVEDGAKIGALLSKETFKQGKEHHLPDGPEQVKRDLLLSKSFEKSTNGEKTWTHPKIQPWIYGYDAYAEVEKAYSLHPF